MSGSVKRRDLLKAVAIALAIWVAILFALAKWQRARPASARGEPELVHYPGTEGVAEQTSPNLGLRKYWFHLTEEYPSKSVYNFYQKQLGVEGWRRLGSGEPEWVRISEKKSARDLFGALWVSPDNLFQLELQMMSVTHPIGEGNAVTGEKREPGIEVFVTQRRSLHPGIIMQDHGREQRSPEESITGGER